MIFWVILSIGILVTIFGIIAFIVELKRPVRNADGDELHAHIILYIGLIISATSLIFLK